jgi:hypothetical protein
MIKFLKRIWNAIITTLSEDYHQTKEETYQEKADRTW